MDEVKQEEFPAIAPYENDGPGAYITINMANGAKAVYFSRGEMKIWQDVNAGGILEPQQIDISDAILVLKEGPYDELGEPSIMQKMSARKHPPT